jgi:hypothetical protein
VPDTVQIGRLLSEFQETRISWISEGRLARGKVTIFDGDPGLGKSTLMIDWIARITTGVPLPGCVRAHGSTKRGVILINGEDDPSDTVVPRLRAAGGDPDKVMLLNEIPVISDEGVVSMNGHGLPKTRLFGLPDDIPMLEQAITHMDAGLVVIDPLMSFFSPDIKSHSDQDIRNALTPLATMAQRTGAAVIMVRHLNKSGGTRALYRGGGSIGIVGIARMGLLLARPKDQPDIRVLASVKSNISKDVPSLGFRLESFPDSDVAVMKFIGEVNYSADDLLEGDAESEEEQDDRSEAVIWLEQFLSSGPRPATEVQNEGKKVGLSFTSLKSAKKKLGGISVKGAFHGSWMWDLPKKDPELEQKGLYDEVF